MTNIIIAQALEGPRSIDPAATFQSLVDGMRRLIVEKNAPGFITGVSGTDSIIAFLASAKAFAAEGRPERAIGVHYGPAFPPPNKTPEEVAKILKLAPTFNYMARTIMPWLQAQAPGADLSINSAIDFHDDHMRWASLFKRSLNGAKYNEPLPPGENFWVVGTRNRTEDAIGSYSNISGAVSVQPLTQLWKSEILQICKSLGVPQIAMERSRQVDCDCGRFDIAADHIEEVDAVLMARQGLVSAGHLIKNIEPELLQRLEAFADEQTRYAAFKKEIPYHPSAPVIVRPS